MYIVYVDVGFCCCCCCFCCLVVHRISGYTQYILRVSAYVCGCQITCFSEGCKTLLPDTLLKKTLSEELFEKYEKFSVNKALETMEDIAWCPQCEGPAFKDSPDAIVAYCNECDFRFCIKCHEKFHPFQRCKLLEVKSSIPISMLKESNKLSNSINSALTNIYVNRYAKTCPKCKAPIIKSGGCNKMTCKKCNSYFCWICQSIINGYEHFNSAGSKCVLFTESSLAERETTDIMDVIKDDKSEEYKAVINGTQEVTSQCPSCGNIMLKPSKLNLLTCDHCKITYCFFCGEKATEEHYTTSQCLKFS